MTATESAAVGAADGPGVAGVGSHAAVPARPPDLSSALDDRTLEILARRQSTSGPRRRGWLVRKALMWSDLVGLSVAFVAAQLLFSARGGPELSRVSLAAEVALFCATLPGWLVVAKLYGLYDRDESRANHSTTDDIVGVFHLVTIGAWLLLGAAWATHLVSPALTKVLIFWAVAVPAITLARTVARAYCRGRPAYIQNTVVVGAGDVGRLVARKIVQHPEYGINFVGFVDARTSEELGGLDGMPVLGSTERLKAIVRELDVERVIVAFSNDSFERTTELVRSLSDVEVQVDIVPRLFDLVSPRVEIHALEGIPLLGIPQLHLSRSSRLLKRTSDLVLATAGLVVLAALLAAIAILVKLDSKGPVLFRQVRIGSGGRRFRMLKFRTMVPDADKRKPEVAHLNMHAQNGGDPRMFKIADDPRVTRVGRLLRLLSLDELPQLVNVLKGEMSLVGPRPLIPDEHRHVEDWARKRLDLRPGMTGLWQVLGRSDIPFEEMVKLDYLYVTTWSLWNDFRLLFRTIPIVVHGRGGS